MKSIGTVLLAWAVITGAAQPPPAPAPPVGGLLAGAVLLGEAPLTEDALPNGMSMSDRLVVVTYLERRQALSARFKSAGGRGDEERQRVALEIAATIETDAAETALAIAASLGPTAGATTSAEDPSSGASWAETLVRDATYTAARPWLYAFLASRYRMQFERAEENRGLLERLAKKYKTMLDRVRNAGDPLFVVLATDLDNRASLSPGVTRHPRQYLPDT
jgi:hypothetical protein